MKTWFAAGAALMLLTKIAWAQQLIPPLRAIGPPQVEIASSPADFHMILIVLLVFCKFLIGAGVGRSWARSRSCGCVLSIAIMFFLVALMFLWVGLSELGAIWDIPQWAVFLLISILLALGLRGETREGCR